MYLIKIFTLFFFTFLLANDINDKIEDGPFTTYHENGQLKERGTYKNGKLDGLYVFYHENGQLWMRGSYKKGKLDGLVFVYQENGQLRKEVTGTYRLGEKID